MTIPFTLVPTLRHTGIAALIALGCVTAQAAIVSQNFSVTIDNNGTSIAGQTFSGSFSFDDATGTAFGTETLFDLTDFSFAFNGSSFSLTDLDAAAPFNAIFENNVFTGLEASSFANGFSFLAADFSYSLDASNAGFGILSVDANAVPEPGTAALALAALGVLAWSRRRVADSRAKA